MNKEILKSYLDKSKLWISNQLDFFASDKGQKIIALLPLFFSWVPVLIYKFENPEIKKKCILALSLTALFLSSIVIGYIISLVPFIGGYIANLLHSSGILLYLAFSIFLVYSEIKNKNVEFKPLTKFSDSLERLLL